MNNYYIHFSLFLFLTAAQNMLEFFNIEIQYVNEPIKHLSSLAGFFAILFFFKGKKYKKENITEKDEIILKFGFAPALFLALIARIIIWLG